MCGLAAQAAAQTTPKVSLDSSETLFSMMAALNACGYDAEIGASEPVRSQVRAEIGKALATSQEAMAARNRVCAFYRDHQQPDASRDLAQYLSLALGLGDPPDFPLTAREADLPPDAAYVVGVVTPLAQFYRAAGLQKIWAEHRYQYESLVERFHDPVAGMIANTDLYLRLPVSGYVGRRFVIYLEPMAAPGQVNARNYLADYYMVISPSGNSLKLDAIRHTYLHYVLDPLVLKRQGQLKRLEPLLETLKSAPIDESYKQDVGLLVVESLIRALEARTMPGGKKKEAEEARENAADAATAEGFILTHYFYNALETFEQGPAGMQDALYDMLHDMDVEGEKKRAREVHFAERARPEVVQAASKKKEAELLDLAEQRLSEKDADAAHRLAQLALEQRKEDPARAMFVLARAASMQGDVQGAQTYFERTLELAREPRILAWSHIYLARILDLKEQRESAVVHYRAALAAGDVSPDTRAAAERGIAQPYEPVRRP